MIEGCSVGIRALIRALFNCVKYLCGKTTNVTYMSATKQLGLSDCHYQIEEHKWIVWILDVS